MAVALLTCATCERRIVRCLGPRHVDQEGALVDGFEPRPVSLVATPHLGLAGSLVCGSSVALRDELAVE